MTNKFIVTFSATELIHLVAIFGTKHFATKRTGLCSTCLTPILIAVPGREHFAAFDAWPLETGEFLLHTRYSTATVLMSHVTRLAKSNQVFAPIGIFDSRKCSVWLYVMNRQAAPYVFAAQVALALLFLHYYSANCEPFATSICFDSADPKGRILAGLMQTTVIVSTLVGTVAPCVVRIFGLPWFSVEGLPAMNTNKRQRFYPFGVIRPSYPFRCEPGRILRCLFAHLVQMRNLGFCVATMRAKTLTAAIGRKRHRLAAYFALFFDSGKFLHDVDYTTSGTTVRIMGTNEYLTDITAQRFGDGIQMQMPL